MLRLSSSPLPLPLSVPPSSSLALFLSLCPKCLYPCALVGHSAVAWTPWDKRAPLCPATRSSSVKLGLARLGLAWRLETGATDTGRVPRGRATVLVRRATARASERRARLAALYHLLLFLLLFLFSLRSFLLRSPTNPDERRVDSVDSAIRSFLSFLSRPLYLLLPLLLLRRLLLLLPVSGSRV